MKEKLVVKFEAGNYNIGVILIGKRICDVCKNNDITIIIDNSSEYFGPGCICKKCIDKEFKKLNKGDI